MDRLIPDIGNQGVNEADLIIEAIPEQLEIKQELYKRIEPRLKTGAILASNTSSIPLDKLATVLKKPGRLLGLHFFNPVYRMQVVEVVSHDKTSAANRKAAMNFATAIGKLPVAVTSYPGFLVNRALTPYLQEAILMLDEGIDKNVIDGVATDFGMPVGPVELADQVGLDICLSVAGLLQQSLDQSIPAIPDWVQKMVEENKLGKKSGQGFYLWKAGKAQKDRARFAAYKAAAQGKDQDISHGSTQGASKPDAEPEDSKGKAGAATEPEEASANKEDNLSHRKGDNSTLSIEDITDRLILPMLNACVECYREGVIEDLDLLDGAMIFATGFAPFRGGPMHYARQRGIAAVTEKLDALSDSFGERFQPDPGWKEL